MNPGAATVALLLASTTISRGAEQQPAAIEKIGTLEKLRALEPVDAGDGWTVRVGLGQGGKEAGPWKLLYCLATHNGGESLVRITHDGACHGKPLGPVFWDIEDGKARVRERSRCAFATTLPAEAIYCAAVPVAWEGRYEIVVLSTKGARLLQGSFAVEEVRPPVWHDFAELRRREGEQYFGLRRATRAAVPCFNGLAPVWRGDAEVKVLAHRDGTPLPGRVPLEGAWQTLATGEATTLRQGDSLPPALRLSLQDTVLVLDSPVPLLTWPDERLLARWWVNGSPVVASLGDGVQLREHARLVTYGKRMQVRLGLPLTLGDLQAGDEVTLQVLYSPGDLELPAKTRAPHALLRALHGGKGEAPPVPLLSNRLKIELTPELREATADLKPLDPEDVELEPDAGEPDSGPLVTISRETTRITEPLREDGYPDYVAALNAITSEGVTRRNNAAVLLWKALGPEEIPRHLRWEYFRALGMKIPSKEGEYLKPLAEFEEELEMSVEPGSEDELPPTLDEQRDEAATRPWSRDEFPLLAQWLEVNEKPLELVVRASRREHYYSPHIPDGDPPLVSGLMAGITSAKSAAQALTTRAMLRAGEKRWEEAARDLVACHRLGRLVGRSPLLIHALIGMAFTSMATEGSKALALAEDLPADVARKHLEQLAELPPPPSMLECLDKGERFFFLDAVCTLARNPSALTAFDGGSSSGGFLDTIRDVIIRSAFDWDEILRIGNRWMDRIVEAGRIEDREEREKALAGVYGDLEAQAAQQSKPLVRAAMMLSAESRSKHVGLLLVSLMLPASGFTFKKETEHLQRLDLVRVALALAAYEGERGEFPEALEALQTEYLEEIPRSRASGEPLAYSRRENGYVITAGDPEEDEGLTISR